MTAEEHAEQDNPPAWLRSSPVALCEAYDVGLLDLDGVVYLGAKAVVHAPESLAEARRRGLKIAFVTNNAARTPDAVATHLNELGVAASPDEVVTSAQAGARLLAERLPAGARVLVVGDIGLLTEIEAVGLVPVREAEPTPDAVAQGYSPATGWRQLAEAVVAVRAGALWLATNLDYTVPSERGSLPGNGAFVDVVRRTTGVDPLVAGKPDPTLHRESVRRTGARHPLVVGDRLDTDIEGAYRGGADSLLVLTGVTTPAELLRAELEHRPTYLGADLRSLLVAHQGPVRTRTGGWTSAGWLVEPVEETLRLTTVDGDGGESADPAESLTEREIRALRALCAAAWETGFSKIAPADSAAGAVAARLGVLG